MKNPYVYHIAKETKKTLCGERYHELNSVLNAITQKERIDDYENNLPHIICKKCLQSLRNQS